jgi:glycosyltransferase involved in cell wall biosynthesis
MIHPGKGGGMALGLRRRAELEALEVEWRHYAGATVAPGASRHPSGPAVGHRELECLRGLLAEDVLAATAARADAVGVSAERVLIANGTITEADYVRRLAAWLAIPFDSLADTPRDQCRGDVQSIRAVAAGLMPIDVGTHTVTAVAPDDARRLIDAVRSYPALAERMRLTTTECLRAFVFRHCRQEIGERAARGLYLKWPELSAAPPRWRLSLLPTLFFGLCALTAFVIAPTTVWVGIEVLLGLIFAAWILLRVAGTLVAPLQPDSPPRRSDRDLPIYSIVMALYREAEVVPALAAALRALDYPLEKLDIKFVVEADDEATQAALSRLSSLPFETIVVPAIEPRTKPRALNVALPFVRGSFVVVYDAEDRPEPMQLRCALETFMAERGNLACVQASLIIDNTADNWLSAMFTAEYAGQFDVFLPALATLRLPLPLGGSSNHFRVSHLRAVGGWDAYNVTEDADLGMRLARFGFRTTVTGTATYEEAPALVWPWLCQRTRWFKGWIQTVNLVPKLNIFSYLRYLLRAQQFHCNTIATILIPRGGLI